MNALSLFVVCAIFWLLLSGHYTPLILTFGVLSCALVAWIGHRMHIDDEEGHPVRLFTHGLVRYWPWLAWEIAKSSVGVALLVWRGAGAIHPNLVRVTPSQRSALGRVIFANSITLTPGTCSLDVTADGILVHALTAGTAADLESGEMDRRVTRMEGQDG
ncbi:Na+/H+ antiporter subunit E [Oceanibacterium hippocampi]|uniref:Na+/H+ antiporter subunit E n=1 Tax=Oceanibacterium hippocampi TaxID=745714 RepID=UPI001C39344E|nr:Na+/H+ antiporter subunit E [Oceanibacterium hippocampi]